MKFEEALVELRKGKKIYIEDVEFICKDFKFYEEATISIKNIFSNDWMVYEQPGKTFDQVFEYFKKGKLIKRKSWSKCGSFFCFDIGSRHLSYQDVLADDWEVLGE